MKISHTIIVLISIIFVSGSMLTVGMDLKRTTNNISTNVVEAKHKYNKEVYLNDTKKDGEKVAGKTNADKMKQEKALYKLKLESLNKQNSVRSSNKFSSGRN
jgi:hypothetical protein